MEQWKTLLNKTDIKTYKTSIWHANSNTAVIVLREVGRMLTTYCHNQDRKWSECITPCVTFINYASHGTTGM